MFFKEADPLEPRVRDVVRDALKEPSQDDVAASQKAAQSAKEIVSAGRGGLSPQLWPFVAAAAVFLVLLGASIYLASAADAQAAAETQLKDLSKSVQTLLVAWSAAVVGLVAGEAVGKKT
jgi:hypothetical protein